MENIHDEAERYGIQRPELEYHEYFDQDENRTVGLTVESDRDWSEYMRAITLARIAFKG